MSELRSRIRNFCYALSAIIVAVILIRFGLRLLGFSPTNNVLIDLFYGFSGIFVNPFVGIATDMGTGISVIEISSIIAIVMWIAFFLIISETITAFLYDSFAEVVINLVNIFFKFIEFFLLVRLLFRGFGVRSGANSFVDLLYLLSGIVYEPFAGLAPGIQIPIGVIEISTVVALIIVIVIDLVTDGLLRSLLPEPKQKVVKTVTTTYED